jgi:hypothetical protein
MKCMYLSPFGFVDNNIELTEAQSYQPLLLLCNDWIWMGQLCALFFLLRMDVGESLKEGEKEKEGRKRRDDFAGHLPLSTLVFPLAFVG